jgi:hypothetical protein
MAWKSAVASRELNSASVTEDVSSQGSKTKGTDDFGQDAEAREVFNL